MNNLNYYADWWEKARNSTGILTKPTYLKQLEQKVKELESKYEKEQNLTKILANEVVNRDKDLATLQKSNQALLILAKQRKTDLEQEKSALINLAKQKITNKKEFQKLLSDLENKWNQEKEELETQLTNLTQENNLSQQLARELTKNCQQLTFEKDNKQVSITNQQEKITRLETILNKSKEDKGTQTIIDYETLIDNEKQKNQEQLKQINLLFDENANSYENIDFEGLYSLLESVVERERAKKGINDFDKNNSPLSHKDRRKKKKSNK